MKKWKITKEYQGTDVEKRFSTLEKVFSCEGEFITRDLISGVDRVTINKKRYYVKKYRAAGKNIRRYLGRSRVRAEWENLFYLKDMGIPVPEIVGFGQKLHRGRFQAGALITEEVVDTVDLAHYVKDDPTVLKDIARRYAVLNQVADYTRKMHESKFVHGDLNWRNILVKTKGAPNIFFIDCPSGCFNHGYYLRKGVVGDLAHLAKLAKEFLSIKDQIKFYKRYKQIEKLSEQDRQYFIQIRNLLEKYRLKKLNKQIKRQKKLQCHT